MSDPSTPRGPRYACVHGHFYQPPRENPWLETVERQDSAYPYRDWNERVTAECYAPNARSRILDGRGRIRRILNNYERISFNFGPTLLSWMEARAPETYAAVLEGERASRERFGGHGSALAQPYNHMIMPLANETDRRTQVAWGLRDFRHRFGRPAEGMWLPETAVDVPTLETLAAAGVRFTILAPHQAARVRPLAAEGAASGGQEGEARAGTRNHEDLRGAATGTVGPKAPPAATWRDVRGGRVDPRRAYVQRLPSGREIALFFYDGPVSRAVAFERLLADGDAFASRILGLFRDEPEPQLVHIATDGETYGHHHTHGEMALSFALQRIAEREEVEPANYALFLERHPPAHEVEIAEATSWSCAHGLERWRSDCGCHTGGEPGWNQAWRRPLREALDWLRDRLAPLYEERAAELLEDPCAARDAYVDVILDRSPEVRERFLAEQARGEPGPRETVRIWKLLEMQRHAMLMYTSCGWFFNELSGIETVQVIQYAGRAVQLAEELSGERVEGAFLDRLARARSNLADWGDGRRVYERAVKPAVMDLRRACAHHALGSLFPADREPGRVYCYAVCEEAREEGERESGGYAAGAARVESEITRESARFAFAALHLGGHELHGAVRSLAPDEAWEEVRPEVLPALAAADPASAREAVQALVDRPPDSGVSLRSLFRDEQRRLLGHIVESTLADVERTYREMHERTAPLGRFFAELGLPLPEPLAMAGRVVVDRALLRALRAEDPDLETVAALLEEVRAENLELDEAGLSFALQGATERLAERARVDGTDASALERLERAVALARWAPFPVTLWRTQNLVWDMLAAGDAPKTDGGGPPEPEERGGPEALRRVGEALGIAPDALASSPPTGAA